VKVRFLADTDLNKAIVSGVLRREPSIDFLSRNRDSNRRTLVHLDGFGSGGMGEPAGIVAAMTRPSTIFRAIIAGEMETEIYPAMQAGLRRSIPFGIFFLCSLAGAQDTKITTLAKTVLALREYASSHSSLRGGLPELTLAKHQLRDWIEFRLASFPEKGDTVALSNDFLTGITNAKLFCDDPSDCVATSVGFLDQVQVTRERGFLIIMTAVGTGIRCGYDYSAYIYEWRENAWRRVWENEQNDYAEGAYRPQTLHTVHISEADAGGARLILTLGTPAGCGGAFVPLYYRVFRATAPGAGAAPGTSPILDKSETLTDEGEPPAIGRIRPDDLLLEFSAGGVAYGLSHKALRHYEIRGSSPGPGAATQTDPIAPTPRDFVEEWLAAPWQDSVARSDSPALREWHEKLHRDDGQGDYPDPALRCMSDPSLVEIATHLEGSPKSYFLVRKKDPLRFSMAGIAENPFPDCTQPDPQADKQPSLLPSNR
jgi:hypothetical protein